MNRKIIAQALNSIEGRAILAEIVHAHIPWSATLETGERLAFIEGRRSVTAQLWNIIMDIDPASGVMILKEKAQRDAYDEE